MLSPPLDAAELDAAQKSSAFGPSSGRFELLIPLFKPGCPTEADTEETPLVTSPEFDGCAAEVDEVEVVGAEADDADADADEDEEEEAAGPCVRSSLPDGPADDVPVLCPPCACFLCDEDDPGLCCLSSSSLSMFERPGFDKGTSG